MNGTINDSLIKEVSGNEKIPQYILIESLVEIYVGS